MEQCEIAVRNVIEVYFRINPRVVHMTKGIAFILRRHYTEIDEHVFAIDTLFELPHEEVHSHDAEDQPEYKADEKHVEN